MTRKLRPCLKCYISPCCCNQKELFSVCERHVLRKHSGNKFRQMLCTLRFVKPGRAWTCYKQIMQNCDILLTHKFAHEVAYNAKYSFAEEQSLGFESYCDSLSDCSKGSQLRKSSRVIKRLQSLKILSPAQMGRHPLRFSSEKVTQPMVGASRSSKIASAE